MIRIGILGWHAIIADIVPFAGLRLVAQAICEHLRANGAQEGPHISFLSERLASEYVKEVLAGNSRDYLCDHPISTPTISNAICINHAVGCLNFSEN